MILENGLEAGDFELDGVDGRDYPDFCDAYIWKASIKENGVWREATEEELDEINENSCLINELAHNY